MQMHTHALVYTSTYTHAQTKPIVQSTHTGVVTANMLGSVEYLIVAQQQLRPHKQQRHSKQISSTAQRYSFCDAIIRTSGPSKHIVLETRTGDNSAQSVSKAQTKHGRGVVARIRRYRMMIRSNNSAHFCLGFTTQTDRGVVRGLRSIQI